ncbi:MAG TPA: R3H domain-containing nucleic acid-binding protein [Ktedonobacterales bacterium]|nr:R3H domain-containing nucleic acid-binding protein [Ktedonobacterales bacterium]
MTDRTNDGDLAGSEEDATVTQRVQRQAGEVVVTDDLSLLMAALPPRVRVAIEQRGVDQLLEVVLDLGRLPEARYPNAAYDLGADPVTAEDIAYVVKRVGQFGGDNRAGIERTLHRISAIRNRRGEVVGLTCRVGRAVRGTVALIRDVIEQGQSLLILGRPGVGKTTLLREAARVLADELGKRVVVVDTSNEIAGDGDIPHPGIGRARRMQVTRPAEQHQVMIEAVENHMPEVIIIDEIGTELEAAAARTIAERGVQLVGTAHGRTLDNLVVNPTLSDLVGGTQTVTLGDEEARRRGTQKTVVERKAPPTFDVLVEQRSWREVVVVADVAGAVDDILRGNALTAERRTLDDHGNVRSETVHLDEDEETIPREGARRNLARGRGSQSGWEQFGERTYSSEAWWDERSTSDEGEGEADYDVMAEEPTGTTGPSGGASNIHALRPAGRKLRIYPFGISRERLEQAGRHLRVPVEISSDQRLADAVITSRNYYRRQAERLWDGESGRKPVYILRTNTVAQIEQCLSRLFDQRRSQSHYTSGARNNPTMDAMQEAEDAIHKLLTAHMPHADLAPQNAYVRRLQHRIAERYNLESRSYGKEPNRRVKIFSR